MSTIERILYSQEHSFITMRSYLPVAVVLSGLSALAYHVIPLIFA